MPVAICVRDIPWDFYILSHWADFRFYVSELQDVCDVLAILHAKARTCPSVYEDSLCAVVNICNQVPVSAAERLTPMILSTERIQHMCLHERRLDAAVDRAKGERAAPPSWTRRVLHISQQRNAAVVASESCVENECGCVHPPSRWVKRRVLAPLRAPVETHSGWGSVGDGWQREAVGCGSVAAAKHPRRRSPH